MAANAAAKAEFFKKVQKFEALSDQHPHLFTAQRSSDTYFLEFIGKKTKDNSGSEQIRVIGNMFYKSQLLDKAWLCYTRSMCCAQPESLELAQAYSNRAKVLFAKKYYKECLQDIERAGAIKAFPRENLSKLDGLKNKALAKISQQPKRAYHDDLPTIAKPSLQNPEAADCLQVQENDKWGIHIVANRDIEPGEVLLVEDAYCQSVLTVYPWQHCTECTELCWNMIPCDSCYTVMFCGEACKNKAASYHKYECKLIQHELQFYKLIFIRLTIKCFTERSEKSGKDFSVEYNKFKNMKVTDPHSTLGEKADSHGMIERVSKILINKSGFLKEINMPKKEALQFLESTMRHNLLVCSERHALVRMVSYNKEKSTHRWIGRGIYSFYSQFNHSCLNNCGYSFYGKKIVVRATRNIKNGEQCFVNYNKMVPFLWHTDFRQEYQKIIYNFKCECRACRECWPMARDTAIYDMSQRKIREMIEKLTVVKSPGVATTDPNHVPDDFLRNEMLKECFKLGEALETEKPRTDMSLYWVLLDHYLLRGNLELDI